MKSRSLVFAAGFVLALPTLAFAALGEHANPTVAAKVTVKAAVRPGGAASNYSVNEVSTASGTLVREYADVQGIVFAVAWDGPTKPDLRSLLGTYFPKFVEGTKDNRAGHSHALINNSGLVINSSGHLRAFRGYAYLPAMLPQGVTIDDLK